MRSESNKALPDSCAAMQMMIEELQWASVTLKLLPNLPKGKLKEEIELELASLLGGSTTHRALLITRAKLLVESTQLLEQKLIEFGKLSKPSSTQFSELKDIVHNFKEECSALVRNLIPPNIR
jgi:hypothetical protein